MATVEVTNMTGDYELIAEGTDFLIHNPSNTIAYIRYDDSLPASNAVGHPLFKNLAMVRTASGNVYGKFMNGLIVSDGAAE